ncbi:helix-turn-helix transcriptional regulator [Clostridium baratii]|uniref:helix-turn-helix domain-containing protein n=1 Tax=Clostridium baratii TaxID=1561 RepID=UPI0030D3426C
MNEFKDRLENYRTNILNISTKREMAENLGISEQLYAMFERGARKPSKSFLKILTSYSNIPETYWLYGIEEDYANERKDFSCIKETVNQLITDGFIDKDVEFNDEIEDILLTALKADIKHLFLKQH